MVILEAICREHDEKINTFDVSFKQDGTLHFETREALFKFLAKNDFTIDDLGGFTLVVTNTVEPTVIGCITDSMCN